MGLGSAYVEAFRRGLNGSYELFVQMDTDLSHDPRYLPELLELAEKEADVVIGSRNVPGGSVEGWGLGRRVLSKGGSLYSRAILGVRIRDLTTGYKVFRRQVLEDLIFEDISSEGYSFQIEVTYRAVRRRSRVLEAPIVFVDRRAGKSKMSTRIFLEAVVMVWKLRFDALRGRL
jgi:dolichol-phosphate mannosyltransferase